MNPSQRARLREELRPDAARLAARVRWPSSTLLVFVAEDATLQGSIAGGGASAWRAERQCTRYLSAVPGSTNLPAARYGSPSLRTLGGFARHSSIGRPLTQATRHSNSVMPPSTILTPSFNQVRYASVHRRQLTSGYECDVVAGVAERQECRGKSWGGPMPCNRHVERSS
jgi:hypothetical protein